MKEIIFNIKPLAKPRMTKRDTWLCSSKYKPRNKKEENRQQMLIKYWNYKDNLNILSKENGYKIDKELKDITFVIKIPKSISKKKTLEIVGKPHDKKPDLDNLIKAFQDCLLDNDSFVYRYNNVQKLWGLDDMIIIVTD